ncbi:MAG: KH domain-containing protein [Chloroflexi bacterium]|nr:KH domain-containing protein [Chloroflexota bacterium]
MPSQEGVGSKELLEFLVKNLVDYPDNIQVDVVDHASETVLELSVAQADMGRVIGKGGRVINSIRTLVQVAAAKEGSDVSIEILEND